MNLSKEEQALAESIQRNLAVAKKVLKEARKDARRMVEIQQEAGRNEAHAGAYRFMVELLVARAGVEKAHSVGTDALCDCFDDGQIVAFGPGGGR